MLGICGTFLDVGWHGVIAQASSPSYQLLCAEEWEQMWLPVTGIHFLPEPIHALIQAQGSAFQVFATVLLYCHD